VDGFARPYRLPFLAICQLGSIRAGLFLCRDKHLLSVPGGHLQHVRPAVPILGDPTQVRSDRRRFNKRDFAKFKRIAPQEADFMKVGHRFGSAKEGEWGVAASTRRGMKFSAYASKTCAQAIRRRSLTRLEGRR
jgi:hypothetical protein